jgi:serine protease Do
MWRPRVGLVLLGALVGSCASTAANAPRARLTPKDIVQRSSPAIVRIEAGDHKIGTGFILDKAGVVATNLHVVAGESTIKVRLLDGTLYPVMQIAGLDRDRDLALLKIVPAKPLPVLKLGDSDTLSAGDQIVAIGNPLGLDYSVTSGLISQVRPLNQDLTILQISAAISPGSSGGPLFNQFGEVVGVTTWYVAVGQSINLAVPGNYLKPLVAQHQSISPDQFAKDTTIADERGGGDDGDPKARIVRKVPRHEIAVYDGCKPEDIGDMVNQIEQTIESGAPLYNDGKHEACYRIYEGTAVKFEHDGACPGIRSAFGDGLLRASGMTSYTEKAWAMRDTFDGLLDAAKRWADKNMRGAPPRAKPTAKPKK